MTPLCDCRAAGEEPSAAQHRTVVLRLLALRMVSPQPPSELTWRASQSSPRRTRVSCEDRPSSRSWKSRAKAAVAVERALVESSPSQCPPSALRERSPLTVAASTRSSLSPASAASPGGAGSSGLNTQVPEREKAVVRVLRVQVVVRPGPVERAAVGPERVDEVEARLAEAIDGMLEARERM